MRNHILYIIIFSLLIFLTGCSTNPNNYNEDDILFFISFDENGYAVKCEEGYRPGG